MANAFADAAMHAEPDAPVASAASEYVPEGYATLEAFLADVRDRFNEAVNADLENRDAALDDLKFLAGEQWDPGVREQRIKKKLPVVTINTLPQYVGQVSGDIRINKPSIKVRPAEDGDKKVAEIRQGLIRFIENQSNAQSVYALAGEDQVGCGLGHFRLTLEYADGDSFDQDIRIKHIPNPFAVVWDPQSTEPTGSDARWCFVVDEIDRPTFETLYPDARASNLVVPLDEAGWVTRDVVRVTEYWVMKPVERTLALIMRPPAEQPSIEDITGREEEMAPLVVKAPGGRPRMRKAIKWQACMYLTNGVELLEPRPYEYPISRLPIFRVSGREVRVGPRRYRFGLVRWAKDPVRMKNLMRSAAAQWIGQSPKQQWLVNAADEEEMDAIRDAGKSDDSVIAYSGPNPPQRLDPPVAPTALLQEASIADQDIKDVTGLQDASLGIKSNETSGKAINARERAGDVATYMYHDNLHSAIRECGKVANELIPVVIDTARTLTILGDDEMTSTVRVNDPGADEPIDMKVGKYDVTLEVGPSYSTRRVEAAESMAQFFQSVPAAGQVAGDLYAKAQDWPMADAIAERLKKAMPPELVEDEEEGEGGQPSPRAAMAAEQANMQMQAQQAAQEAAMRRSEMDLAEQKAKTRQAEANADKAKADARKAELELMRLEAAMLAPAMEPEPEGASFDPPPPDAFAEAPFAEGPPNY